MSDKNTPVEETDENDVNNGPEDNDKNDSGHEDVKDNAKGDDAGNEDDDEEDEPLPDGKKVYSEDEFKRAVKRRQAALDRAKAAEARVRDLEKQHATKEDRLRIEAEEKAEAQAAKFKPALVRQHVAYEMSFLGLSKTQIEELVQFVDMTKIDVDLEDNSVDGVEEEVLRIKEKFPSIFANVKADDEEDEKKNPRKKRVPKGDGSPKPAPKKELSAKEKIVARLRGENV